MSSKVTVTPLRVGFVVRCELCSSEPLGRRRTEERAQALACWHKHQPVHLAALNAYRDAKGDGKQFYTPSILERSGWVQAARRAAAEFVGAE